MAPTYDTKVHPAVAHRRRRTPAQILADKSVELVKTLADKHTDANHYTHVVLITLGSDWKAAQKNELFTKEKLIWYKKEKNFG